MLLYYYIIGASHTYEYNHEQRAHHSALGIVFQTWPFGHASCCVLATHTITIIIITLKLDINYREMVAFTTFACAWSIRVLDQLRFCCEGAIDRILQEKKAIKDPI